MKSSIVIALVGRPNVGKSTFFNRLARKRIAIVDDQPGVTRDRNMAFVDYKGYHFTMIDTGGFEPDSTEYIPKKMREQSQLAVEEADAIIFVLDRTLGWNPQDREIWDYLRRSEKPVYFAVNKVDGPKHELEIVEFYESGAERLFPVSAEHGRGIIELLESIEERFPEIGNDEKEDSPEDMISVAVVGRPNAGKSSIVNRFLGEEKHIVHHEAGTTRDPIDSYYKYHGKTFKLIDTAGIRKKSRVSMLLDKYSMIASLKSVERADVALLVLDATEGVVDQDMRIARLVMERGRSLVIVVNKWDLVNKDSSTLEKMKEEILYQLKFVDFCPVLFVSALSGKRLPKVIDTVMEVHKERYKRVQTADVNRILESILIRHMPPARRGRPTKLYYASQVASAPPVFTFTSNNPDSIPDSYRRFMESQLRHYFGFSGTPVKIFWRNRDSKKETDSQEKS